MGRARQEHQGIFTAPMDHSYRANMGMDSGNGNQGRGPRRPGFSASYPVVDPEPLPAPREDAASRVFAFVEDLFFLSKIQDAGRKMNVKVEFVKNEKELTERMQSNGEEKPSLIIFDLNNANAKPLTLIPKLKSKLKKGTSIVGFLSHAQGDLKQKAHEVGCDMVLPRSAFSQNLPQLLRRHGAVDDESTATQ
jgi:CheY-like chemotaxis protein